MLGVDVQLILTAAVEFAGKIIKKLRANSYSYVWSISCNRYFFIIFI